MMRRSGRWRRVPRDDVDLPCQSASVRWIYVASHVSGRPTASGVVSP